MISTSHTSRFFLRAATVSASIEHPVQENDEEFAPEHAAIIRAFCPRSLASFFATSSSITARSQIHVGCCALVDVSGFTRLSQVAFQTGAAGLDKFRRNINDVLGYVADTVIHFGGDVIAFAGDALICYFCASSTARDHQKIPSECVVRAVSFAVNACSLRLDGISVHAAVSEGEVCFGVVGGYEDMWSYVMSSLCFEELRQCINVAGPQEIVIPNALYDKYQLALAPYFTTAVSPVEHMLKITLHTPLLPAPEGGTCIETMICDAKFVSRFVPKPVISAVTSEALDGLAEVRVISTLFLRLDSYDSHENRDVTTLQPFYVAMQEIVFEYGGYIRQFIIDDKGCVLIVLWGVPGASFPNNCCRAVHSAADMHRTTKLMKSACSIGISTGTAYCGTVGSHMRRDYVAMGKSVNFAARLMMAAKGRILLDAATRECLPIALSKSMSDGKVDCLKDFSESSPCFEFECGDNILPMLTSVDVPRDDAIFASNEVLSSLENVMTVAIQLKDSSRIAVEGASLTHFFILKGVPGSGKSSIVQKFCRDATKYEVSVVFFQLHRLHREDPHAVFCMITQELRPLSTVEDLLSEFFQGESSSLLQERRNGLQKILSSLYSSIQSSKKSVKIHPILYDAKDDTAAALLSRLLRKESITAIVIDGAEYISEASWILLSQLGHLSVPVVVLCALSVKGSAVSTETEFIESVSSSSRSMNSERVTNIIQSHGSNVYEVDKSSSRSFIASLHLLLEAANTSTIMLSPLSFEAVARQVCEAFVFEAISAHIIHHIYEVSKGNAFWVCLLIRFVRDCGVNEFEKLLDLHMANNILAACLLAKYTLQQCNMIKAASVCGEEFDVDVLIRIIPQTSKKEIVRVLSLFVHGGLIYRSAELRYKFHNTLIRKAVYDMIPKSDVENMHFKVAQAIRANDTMADHIKYPILAYHLACSGSERMHYALRYAHAAAVCCVERNNIALGMCYVSLGLRVAVSKTDLEKLLSLVEEVIVSVNIHEDTHHSTHEHVAKLRSNILRALAKLEDEVLKQQALIFGCCYWRISLC